MRVADLIQAIEAFAPPTLAESWDAVGLQVGSPASPLNGPVLLTIDLTEPVLEEAIALKASVIVSYHPPIFEPLRQVTDRTPRQRIVLGAIQAGIAIYSPHTALDAAQGGVTDWLCEGLSGGTPGSIAGDCRALVPHSTRVTSKIVTFVPAEAADRVRDAMASSGAGAIGSYRVCSFSSPGQGTFFGAEGTDPAVGESGRFETVDEVRLEMICSPKAVPLAVEALRHFHPYEEPAIDVYELAGVPRRGVGPGRKLVLDQPVTAGELAERLRGHLIEARLQYALPDVDIPVRTIGVVPGSGASLARLAREQGAELFVTGEMKHHEILASLHAGMGVLLAGHTNTERGYLPRFAERLRSTLTDLDVRIATRDHDLLHQL
jgi:dinuclear metal center YbgI/SA1388 family protein